MSYLLSFELPFLRSLGIYLEPLALVFGFLVVSFTLWWVKARLLRIYPEETIRKTSILVLSFFIVTAFGSYSSLKKVGFIALVIQVGLWVSIWIPEILKKMFSGHGRSALPIFSLLLQIAVWILICLFLLENLGFDTTALLTGLGIGGIAIALAAQNVLSDIFASLSIILDRPFLQGDFIEIDGTLGEVREIRLKTTKIKSQTGEEVIFSNSELLKMKIRNFSRMDERRIQLMLSLSNLNSHIRWEEISGVIRETILSMEGVRFDRASLHSYTPTALLYEVVFYSLTPLAAKSLERQEYFLCKLAQNLYQRGLLLADSSLTVTLKGK